MTTTCPQCGAILRAESSVCSYCDSRLVSSVDDELILSSHIAPATFSSGATRGNLALEPEWRAELSRRVDAYRRRHRRAAPENQAQLPFDSAQRDTDTEAASAAYAGGPAVAVDAPPEEDFAFSIAIGRHGAAPAAAMRRNRVERVEIDLSAAPGGEAESAGAEADLDAGAHESRVASPLFPVASLGARGTAAMVDAIFLLFSYGGFLTLFGSLGGQFSFSKLSAIVYVSTFVLFYLQYFALFTVFGGTTPGMTLRGLQVVSSTGPDGFGAGDRPSPRQLLLRSLGYLLSAGTFLLGFVWACWDEDHLTWHDRISRTYLTSTDAPPHAAHPAPGS